MRMNCLQFGQLTLHSVCTESTGHQIDEAATASVPIVDQKGREHIRFVEVNYLYEAVSTDNSRTDRESPAPEL